MKYSEQYGNLFAVDKDYCLCHCISADYALGAGIAVQFNRAFNLRNLLCQKFPQYRYESDSTNKRFFDRNGLPNLNYGKKPVNPPFYPRCLEVGRVFNLVTKEQYWQKPTYHTLQIALMDMKRQLVSRGVRKIAMPTIGSGLDGLNWQKVSKMIQEIFIDTEIEILVIIRK